MKLSGKYQALAYLGAVFVAGALAGWFGGRAELQRRFFAHKSPEAMAEHVMRDMEDQLQLTADQVAQLRPLVTQTASNLHQLFSTTLEQAHQVTVETEGQIRQRLKPEQLPRFEKMLKDRDRRLGGRHPPAEPAPPSKVAP